MSFDSIITREVQRNGRRYEVTTEGEVFAWRLGYRWKTEKRIRLKFSVVSTGYLYTTTLGYAHRLIAEVFLGPPPTAKHTDVNHKNGIKDDNRLCNLEWCTRSENLKHSYGVLKRKTPLGRNLGGGVCFDKSRNKWMSYLGDKKNRTYQGRFDTEEEAWTANRLARQTR